jgi:hypothetical protein
MAPDVQPVNSKTVGTMIDLFFGYGKPVKIQTKESKLICDLFLNKTPVITTPNFNLLYDIFLGP